MNKIKPEGPDLLMPGQTQERSQRGIRWMPILMYHRVVAPGDLAYADQYSVSTTQFMAQMKYLVDGGYQSIYLDDVPAAVGEKPARYRKPVAITFDDGYLDTFANAYPILQEYGLNATVMLISDLIKPNGAEVAKLDCTELMNISQIREMSEGGVRFGSHSATHRSLMDLNIKQARREIFESKTCLEDLLGEEVNTFGYPYGRSSVVHHEMSREAGYKAACGIGQREHSLFNLNRIDAAYCTRSWLQWRLKISGIHSKLRNSKGLAATRKLLRRRAS